MKTVAESIADQTDVCFMTDFQFASKYLDDLDDIEKITKFFFNDMTQHLPPSQLPLSNFKRHH